MDTTQNTLTHDLLLTSGAKALLNRVGQHHDGTIELDSEADLDAAGDLVAAGLVQYVGSQDPGARPNTVRATTAGRELIHQLWPTAPVGTLPFTFHKSVAAPRRVRPLAALRSQLAGVAYAVIGTVEDGIDDLEFWADDTVRLAVARTNYELAVRRARRAARRLAEATFVERIAYLQIWAAAMRELAALQPLVVRDIAHFRDTPAFALARAQRDAADIADALAAAAQTPTDRQRPPARFDIETAAGPLLERARHLPPAERDADDPSSLVNQLKRALWPVCGRGVRAISLLYPPANSGAPTV